MKDKELTGLSYFGERIPENPRDAFREGLKYGASQDATRVP